MSDESKGQFVAWTVSFLITSSFYVIGGAWLKPDSTLHAKLIKPITAHAQTTSPHEDHQAKAQDAHDQPHQDVARAEHGEHKTHEEHASNHEETKPNEHSTVEHTKGDPSHGASHKKSDWSYEGNHGPSHWGSVSSAYKTCQNGHLQSPIALQQKDTRSADIASKIDFHYQDDEFQINAGDANLTAIPHVQHEVIIQGKTYALKDFRFHTPSEHTLEGKVFPMELQLLHQSSDGSQLAFAVLFEVGRENQNLSIVQKSFHDQGSLVINPLWLIPQRASYFRYEGSLTVPPCHENVVWNVFKNPLAVSPAQIEFFTKQLGHNARPIQADHDRAVIFNSIDELRAAATIKH